MALSKFLLGGWIFVVKGKKNETSLPSLAETTELEVRGLSQINF